MAKFSYILNLGFFVVLIFYTVNKSSVDMMIFGPEASLPDGSVYSGDISDGKFNGTGTLIFPSGDKVSGEFKDGYIHGHAKISKANGEKLEGQFKKGYPSGPGVFSFSSDGEYIGEFDLGYFNGQGKLSYSDGQFFSGEFSNGDIVDGAYEDGEGTRYEGEFKDYNYHGKGKLIYESGDIFEGTFVDGALEGFGKHVLEGSTYEGEFQENYYHGKGKLAYEDGSHYEGEFYYGLRHGEGKYISFDEEGNEVIEDGQWEYDYFIDSERELRLQTQYAGDVIYKQEDLFRKLENQIELNNSTETDFYFLGIAGDGSQNVFLNEIRSIEKIFSQHYDLDSKSILLVNHTDTSSEYPIATKFALTRALSIISKKMDLENDVLFFYMTSHGSKSHTFSLNDTRMKLKGLTTEDLKQALDPSGIKWKAILISSCYSGGHIEKLSDENTLLITSSRADRQSFGCTYDGDMTYFGRALHDTLAEGIAITESY